MKRYQRLILGIVFLAVFNLSFFLFSGDVKNASVWISYAMIHFSFAPFLAGEALSSRLAVLFPAAALNRVLLAYAVLESGMGLIFILVGSEKWQTAFLIQLLLLLFFVAALVPMLVPVDREEGKKKKKKKELPPIMVTSTDPERAAERILVLMDKTEDDEFGEKLEELYELLLTAPTVVPPDAEYTLRSLMEKIPVLEKAEKQKDINATVICTEAIALAEEYLHLCRRAQR